MKKLVIRFNAPVILSFALLSLIVLLLDGATGGVSTHRFFSIYRSSLADPLTYVRLFGHVLGHTGYSHYMGNMLLLLLVGPGVEARCGSRRTLFFFLITAAVGVRAEVSVALIVRSLVEIEHGRIVGV